LIVDVETRDTRKVLRIKDPVNLNSKQPKPVCG